MNDAPRFYGVGSSNMSLEGLWSREMFPKSFAVALCNRLRDEGRCINYVEMGPNLGCRVRCIPVDEVYGTDVPSMDLTFDFDSVHVPHLRLASGIPSSDLIVKDGNGTVFCRFDMQASVIPDASTKGLAADLAGPEMTVRTPTLKNLALSMAESMLESEIDVIGMLSDGIPEDIRWNDWNSVSPYSTETVDSLNTLESRNTDCQRPFLIQSLWKSEEGGPLMAEDAMDVFVWSDFAFSRLFLDSTRRPSDRGPTRPLRSAVRLRRMLCQMAEGRHPDLDGIILETTYGLPSGTREFMVNGRTTNRYMACERLSRPAFPVSDVPSLASKGFESMITPERRLDDSVYYAVRAARG